MTLTSHAPRRLVLTAALLLFTACSSTEGTDTSGDGVPAPAGESAAAPASPLGGAQPMADDPMGVSVHVLSNGVTVMLSENHEEPRFDAWITTRAGGAKDPADATGMAHYLEHMQFKGTPLLGTMDWAAEKPHLDRITELYDELFTTTDEAKRKELYAAIDAENQQAAQYAVPNEFDNLYGALGAQGVNAFTSNDQTSYVVNLPSNRLEQWAEVETERLREPVYRLFQSELEAVYEEKNRGMDNAARVTNEAMMAALFPQHPYGTQTVLGHVEHLKNPSLTKMYRYFHDWYGPGNLCVAIAGDIDRAQVLETLERTLGKLEPRPFPADPVFPLPAPQGVQRVEVHHRGEEEVQIGFLLPNEKDPDYDALVLCDMMLANGNTGLIDLNLNQAQKVRSAGCGPRFMLDAGLQLFSATPKPNQSLDELESLLLEQIALLKKGEFTDDDVAAVLTDFEIRKKRELETNRSRVSEMTDAFILRMPWEQKVHAIDRLRHVTREQMLAAANKWFGGNYVVVRRLNKDPEHPTIPKPNFTPVKIDAARHSAWFGEILGMQAPAIEPRWVVEGRDVQELPLRTGKLVYTRNPLNDVFDLTFTIPGGTDADPKLGLGFALLDLGGAGDLDGAGLKRKLYALGSSISAGASREECVVSVSGLDANLAATLALLRDHFERPTGVGAPDLANLMQRVLAGRKAQKNAPRAIAAALGEFGQRGADSAFLRQPTNEELATWTADDLLARVRDVWKFRRTVSYVGQIPAEQLAPLVDLPPVGGTIDQVVEAPARKPVDYQEPADGTRILVVDAKAAQSQVVMFATDGTFTQETAAQTKLYNEYMGGSMGGVIFQEVRESRSLAYDPYGVYRTAAWKEDENLLQGGMGTQADKTAEAVEVLLGLLRRMPPSEQRMKTAVESIDQSYRTGRISFRRIPNVWEIWDHQGLDGDPRPQNWEAVLTMQLPQFVEWAGRFEDRPFTICITGPVERIDMERLGKLGKIEQVQVDQLFSW